MKVTNQMTFRLMQAEMNKTSNRLMDLRQQASSGLKFNKPSDDPSSVRPVLDYSANIQANQRYQENMSTSLNRMQAQDGNLEHVTETLVRVKEQTIQAINASVNEDDLDIQAEEVRQMKKELLDTANSQLDGKFQFAGYEEGTKPFVTRADGSVAYQGDDQSQKVDIGPGEKLEISIPGRELFLGEKDTNGDGTADTKIGQDVFKTLNNIEELMRNGGPTEVSGSFGGSFEGWEYEDGSSYDQVSFDLKLGSTNLGTVDVDMSSDHDGNPISSKSQLADEIGHQLANTPAFAANRVSVSNPSGGDNMDGDEDSVTFNDGSGNNVTITRTGNSFDFQTTNGTSFKVENFSETVNNDNAGPEVHKDAVMRVTSDAGTQGDAILKDEGGHESVNVHQTDLNEQLGSLEDGMNRVEKHRGKMGVRMNRVETSINKESQAENDLKQLLSNYRDADIMKTSSQMMQQETALKAAMSVTSRVSQISILNYM
jgi:flagellar hook-associated protein 3 FlgL